MQVMMMKITELKKKFYIEILVDKKLARKYGPFTSETELEKLKEKVRETIKTNSAQ